VLGYKEGGGKEKKGGLTIYLHEKGGKRNVGY